MFIKAQDSIIGNKYYSPKGIPCIIVEIKESTVLVKSLITDNEFLVPGDFPLTDKYEVEICDNKDKGEKKVIIKKIKKDDNKMKKLRPVLFTIVNSVNPNENVVLSDVINKVREIMPEISEEKILSNLQKNVFHTLKKQGLCQFTKVSKNPMVWKKVSIVPTTAVVNQ